MNDIYQELLGRDVDPSGLAYYGAQLEAGVPVEQVARNVIAGARANEEASKISQEEYDRYYGQPTSTAPTQNQTADYFNEQFVRDAYENFLGVKQTKAVLPTAQTN